MNTKQLVTTAAFLVALAVASPSAHALTQAQEKAVRQAVKSVPVAEMAAKAVELVNKADKKDRRDVALVATRAAILKSRTSAPLIVSAISKAAPELAAIVSQTAAELEAKQAGLIARAAILAAPASRADITASVSRGAASGSTVFQGANAGTGTETPGDTTGRPTGGRGTPRPSADGPITGGTVTQSDTPIAGGDFGSYSTTPITAEPEQVCYTCPRGI